MDPNFTKLRMFIDIKVASDISLSVPKIGGIKKYSAHARKVLIACAELQDSLLLDISLTFRIFYHL